MVVKWKMYVCKSEIFASIKYYGMMGLTITSPSVLQCAVRVCVLVKNCTVHIS